jgi:peptidoglycan/LPS O-acetylase OafA/YrhL
VSLVAARHAVPATPETPRHPCARHVVAASAPAARRAFRPDIQALRAVAVAGVVVFHLWPAALPGGFVGVDVFFVVSGFLITQQHADEADATGRISLTRFWARRIRRILPAALVVLAATTAAVVLLVPRVAWRDNLPDVRAAALYVENWQLAGRAVDYLAAEADPSLVQHYWSLSVEEQFYLAWPLLVLLAVVLSRRMPALSQRAWPVAVLTAAGLSSFVLSVLWTAADAPTAFFATPTRAWEFAAGGLAALLAPEPAAGGGKVRAALGGIGLVVVLAAMGLIHGDQPFPGVIALVPVLGATLVVAAGLSQRWAGRPAGLAPVQWVGDRSYAIYLWHWPLLVALPWVVHRDPTGLDLVAVLVVTLALSALTKVAIEDPVRTRRMWRSRIWLTYAIPVVGISALIAATTVVTDRGRADQARAVAAERAEAQRETQALVAAPEATSKHGTPAPRPRSCFGAAAMDPANRCANPFARPPSLDPAVAATDGATDPCLQKYDAASPTYCTLGRSSHPVRTVAVVGNSHAWRLLPALELYADRHGWRIIVAERINCLGLVTSADQGPSRNCLTWSAAVQRRLLALPHLDAVIFPGYSFSDEFTVGHDPTAADVRSRDDQVLRLWSAFASRGTQVIVTQDVPGMRPTNDPQCIARSRVAADPCAVDRASVLPRNPVADLARANPRLARYIPLEQYFCDARRCHGLIGGVVVYFDSHHLTTTYSRSLAVYLGDAVAADLHAH